MKERFAPSKWTIQELEESEEKLRMNSLLLTWPISHNENWSLMILVASNANENAIEMVEVPNDRYKTNFGHT